MEQTELLASGLRREIETASETIKAQIERAEQAEAALALAQSGSRVDVEGPLGTAGNAKGQQHLTGIFDSTTTEIPLPASEHSAELDGLRSELAQVRAELAEACLQRDVLRTSFRSHANLLAESRLLQAAEAEELRRRNAECEGRAADLKRKAADWEQRYMGLRRRLEAILTRFGILGAARLFPRSLRAFVRNRILGPGRT
jgi:hypothetical protein